MAHKLLPEVIESPKKAKRLTLPNINGKFGVALFVGGKEVFIGITLGDVEIERIVKKRFIKVPKARVNVYKFDEI